MKRLILGMMILGSFSVYSASEYSCKTDLTINVWKNTDDIGQIVKRTATNSITLKISNESILNPGKNVVELRESIEQKLMEVPLSINTEEQMLTSTVLSQFVKDSNISNYNIIISEADWKCESDQIGISMPLNNSNLKSQEESLYNNNKYDFGYGHWSPGFYHKERSVEQSANFQQSFSIFENGYYKLKIEGKTDCTKTYNDTARLIRVCR